jgi:O-antigen ligase
MINLVPAPRWQGEADRSEGAGPAASWLPLAALALFALGIALDVMIARRLGSSSAVLGAPLVVAGCWQVVIARRVRPLPVSLLLVIAFTAWAAVSVVWARDQESLLTRITTYGQLLAFVLLSWQLVPFERACRALLLGFVVGCVGVVVGVWEAFLSGRAVADQMYEGGTRFAVQGFDPNDMAVTLALAIPMAAHLALTSGRLGSYLALGYVPLAGSAIVLSGSRGAAVTALVAVLCFLVWLGSRRKGTFAFAVVLLAAGAAFAWSYIPWDTWSRLFTLRQQLAGGGTVGDRAQIWRAGLEVFAHHPVVGVGAGGFPAAVVPAFGSKVTAHSTLLSVGVDLGIIGLLLFVGAFVAALRRVLQRTGDARALGLSLLASWLVGSASLSWEARKTTWLVLLLCAALGAMDDGSDEKERA